MHAGVHYLQIYYEISHHFIWYDSFARQSIFFRAVVFAINTFAQKREYNTAEKCREDIFYRAFHTANYSIIQSPCWKWAEFMEQRYGDQESKLLITPFNLNKGRAFLPLTMKSSPPPHECSKAFLPASTATHEYCRFHANAPDATKVFANLARRHDNHEKEAQRLLGPLLKRERKTNGKGNSPSLMWELAQFTRGTIKAG